MALFTHKLTGALVERPAHYANDPVLGKNLVPVESSVAVEVKPSKVSSKKKTVETAPIAEPLTSAAETAVEAEIEVNIETDKE